MIFLYTFALFFLGAAKLLIDCRAASLEKKYIKTVDATDQLLHDPALKPNTSNKPDLCETAKKQVSLGLLMHKQDRLEGKYEGWQGFAKKYGAFVGRLRGWKGKKLPYTLGVVDVSLVLTAIDYLGVGDYVSFRRLSAMIAALVTN